MRQEILLAMNAHNQHWELLMGKNQEIVLMKIRPRHLGAAVMHVYKEVVSTTFKIYNLSYFQLFIVK